MVDLVHERAEPQAVAQEYELVLVFGALLPDAREELDGLGPLLVRELRLARERVQAGYEGGNELQRAGVLAECLVQLLNAVGHIRHERAIPMPANLRTYWSVIV